MLLLGLWIGAVIIACWIWGNLVWHGLARLFGLAQTRHPAFGPLVLIGLAGISFLANFASLFIPLGSVATLVFAAGSFAAAWLVRMDLRWSLADFIKALKQPVTWVGLLVGAAVLGVILFKGSEEPTNYDTGLYHAQAIQWTQLYPVVPGLANFAERLGFNSAWLVFGSMLVGKSGQGAPMFSPAAFLFAVLAIEACTRLARLARGEVRAAHLLAVGALLLGRRLLTWELSSPGTDLPATVLLWMVFLYGLDQLESGERGLDVRTLAVLAGALLVTTVKLSAAPVLLLAAFFLIRANRKEGRPVWLTGLLMGAWFFLPWLARSVILSGYLVYPLPQVDVFRFDWKVPYEQALISQQGITAWARWPNHGIEEVLALPLSKWVPIWWGEQAGVDRVLVVGIVAAWLILGGWAAIRCKQGKPWPAGWSAVMAAVSWAGAFYWFAQAPAFRFGYGFLGFLILYPAALAGQAMLLALPRRAGRAGVYLLAAVLLAYQGATLLGLREGAVWRERWFWPAAYPVVEVRTVQQGGFSFQFPASGNQCWSAPLPCTAFPNEKAEPRGNGFASGFRSRP